MTYIEREWSVSTDPHDNETSALSNLSALTPAEQAVLDQALTGAPAREIAERLTLSEATVRSHLSRIYVKLGVSGRVALLAAFREAESADDTRGEPQAARTQAIGPLVRPAELTVGAGAWGAIGGLLLGTAVAMGGLAIVDRMVALAPLVLVALVLGAAIAAALSRRLWSTPTRPNVARSAVAAAALAIVGIALLMDASGGDVLQQMLGAGVTALALGAGLVPLRAWERL